MTTTPPHPPGDRPWGRIDATRSPAVGRHGMVATSQPLASAAALGVLQQGGNAVDAALTAASVLAVVEPSMTGIGGDLFALVYDPGTRRVHGLDACGRAPAAATPETYAARGLTAVPAVGALAVNVPGVVSGWEALASRYGSWTLDRILEPAIRHAHDGFPVAELMAFEWQESAERLAGDAAASATFLPNGRPPAMGEIFANPGLATSLAQIARDGAAAFYSGPIAEAIDADMRSRGGLLTARDLAAHTADWVEPISAIYRGVELYEMPPSTQGLVALEMLNILEGFDLAAMGHNSADYLHVVSEAKKIAFADRGAYLADRRHMPAGTLDMLTSKSYAAARRGEIDLTAAKTYGPGAVAGSAVGAVDFTGRDPTPSRRVRASGTPDPTPTRRVRASGTPDRGDTVYLTVADDRGLVVSFIQSLFASFGAAIVAGQTGITLNSRSSGFVLTSGHPNRVGPNKRPLHTLIPAMLLQNGRPWVSFGVMGGDNQAQAHAQIVTKLVDFGMHVQTAGDSARVRHIDQELAVERGIPAGVRASLEARGHRLRDGRGQMGGYQAIMIDQATGVMLGGSDHRKDGLAIGW